jgi:hypothetical protein
MKLGLQKADITGYPIIIYLFKDLLLVYNYWTWSIVASASQFRSPTE